MYPASKNTPSDSACGPVTAVVGARLPLAFFRFEAPCIVCVSGGRDSMLLLEFFRELFAGGRLAHPPTIFHCMHGLRGAAGGDAEFVRGAARRHDLPLYLKEGDAGRLARRTGQSLEEAGRNLRTRAVRRLAERIDAGVVATGHYADDYVERVLLHLARGGGPDAMRTMPLQSRRDGLNLLRPLLVLSRAEIDALIRDLGIEYREDETNTDESFRRNRLRARVLPELRELGLDPVKMWLNFHELPEASDLDFNTGTGTEPTVGQLRIDRSLFDGADFAQWKRVLDPALGRLGLPPAGRAMLEELRRQYRRGGAGFRFAFASRELVVWSDGRGPVWLFHRGRSAALRSHRVLEQNGDHVRFIYNGREARVSLKAGHELAVWRPGDRVRLLPGPGDGAPGSRKLKKVFQERGIPAPIRRLLPLVRERDTGYVVRLCLGLWEGRDLLFGDRAEP